MNTNPTQTALNSPDQTDIPPIFTSQKEISISEGIPMKCGLKITAMVGMEVSSEYLQKIF